MFWLAVTIAAGQAALYNGLWVTELFIWQTTHIDWHTQVYVVWLDSTKRGRGIHTHPHTHEYKHIHTQTPTHTHTLTHKVGESMRNVCYVGLSRAECTAWGQQLGPFMLVLDKLKGMCYCLVLSIKRSILNLSVSVRPKNIETHLLLVEKKVTGQLTVKLIFISGIPTKSNISSRNWHTSYMTSPIGLQCSQLEAQSCCLLLVPSFLVGARTCQIRSVAFCLSCSGNKRCYLGPKWTLAYWEH